MLRYLLPMVLGLPLLVGGCKKEEPPKVTPQQVEKKVAEAASTAADYARQEKDEYIAQAQKSVDEAKAEIDKLKAEARKAGAGAKRKLQAKVEAMERKWRLAEGKLKELKSASGEAWRDLRAGVDKAIADLKQSRARSRPPTSSASR